MVCAEAGAGRAGRLLTRRDELRGGAHASAKEGNDHAMKTTRQRADAKRQEKLDGVRANVESGSLIIRQMTAEERQRYPPRPARSKPNEKR